MHGIQGCRGGGRTLGHLTRHLQGQLGMLIAHRTVLQGMGTLGHHQVGQVTDLWCMRRTGVFIGLQAAQNPFMLNGRQSQGARAQKPTRHPLALGQQQ